MRQGNVFTPVCHSVHGEGALGVCIPACTGQGCVCIPACTGQGCVCISARTGQGGVYHPWGRQPPTPWADTPHTLGRLPTPLGRHPPPPTTTAVDGTHPTGIHSCFNVLYWPRLAPQFLRPILAKKWNILIITAHKRSLRRLCFYRCVSVHRGEYLGRYPPRTRCTPWAGNPRDQVHPLWDQVQPPPQDQLHPPPRDQVHPSRAVHAGRYGQHAGGMHPTGMHSC